MLYHNIILISRERERISACYKWDDDVKVVDEDLRLERGTYGSASNERQEGDEVEEAHFFVGFVLGCGCIRIRAWG